MKFKNLNYLVFFVYLISSSGSYSIERPDITNLIIHNEKKNWPNPTKFDPERFLTSTDRNPYAWIPFSAGGRNGSRFELFQNTVI